MERKVTTERLYSLGDFRNIKFYDEISNIPEEIALNKDAMALVRYLQLLEIERGYREYVRIAETFATLKLEEAMEYLESERVRTFEELLKTIYQTKTKE